MCNSHFCTSPEVAEEGLDLARRALGWVPRGGIGHRLDDLGGLSQLG